MKWKLTIVLLLLLPAFASEEKDEKKALEAQAKELVRQAKVLEKSGELVEARKRYASSQAFWEMKDAEKSINHIDAEIHKRVKEALKQAHQFYDQSQFQPAIEKLRDAQQLGNSAAVLSYDIALCYRKMEDGTTALGYLDEAILATADPKRSAKLKQLRTVWVTGEQVSGFRDTDKDHIVNLNRLMDSIGFDASLEDGIPAVNPNPSDPLPQNQKIVETSFVASQPTIRSHANTKARRSSSLCQALEDLKKATATTPAITFDLANCAEDNDRLGDAVSYLRHYLEISSNASDATRVHLRIAELDALLNLPEPTGSQVRNLVSAASRSLEERKFDRALDQFQKAVTAAPDFAPAYWRLALMYEAMGNVDQAREYFTRYRQMETNTDAQAEADIHLDTLDTKKDKYDEEMGAAEDLLSELLNRAMDLTFNGMEDRTALYKQRQRARKQNYQDKKKLRQVGGFGVPFAYAQQQLADAGDHLAVALGLFPHWALKRMN